MVSKTRTNPQPSHPAFTPVTVIFRGIFNKTYGEKFGGDLKGVERDLEDVMQIIKDLGIPAENFKIFIDATRDEVEDLCDKTLTDYYKAARRTGTKTLFIFWYGGHAEMAGSEATQITFNTEDPKERCYPWERRLRMFAATESTYTIAFFDCCRN